MRARVRLRAEEKKTESDGISHGEREKEREMVEMSFKRRI